MSKTPFQEAFGRLRAEAVGEVESASPALLMNYTIMREALSGDPSFLQSAATNLCRATVEGRELSPMERLCLATILGRLSSHQAAAIALSGSQKKGAPRKGKRSLDIAIDVVTAIMDEGATSVEKAWEMAGAVHNVEPSTVKKYWMHWKPHFQDALSDSYSSDGLVKGFDNAIKDMMRTNAGK